jgi:tetratricopeptide (TPR) repeat protein
VEGEEELDLVFDETVGTPPAEPGDQEVAEDTLDLILDEEGGIARQEEAATTEQPTVVPSSGDQTEESLAVTEEQGSNEYDEDIPFIDEGEEAFARTGDMDVAPALADVPDDYAQITEDETPNELAERLEYFLGTDEDEPEPEESAVVDETAEKEEEAEAVSETVDAEPVVVAEPGISLEGYSADLREQEERLRRAMNAAIENRETGKINLLGTALESLCVKQADIQTSFQQHRNLLDELDSALNEVHQALPGFQLETVRTGLQKGEHEVVRTLLLAVENQLQSSPQLASRMLYQWGRIEEERGELAAALEMYARARAGDEENPAFLYAAGRLARITGDTDNAVSWLEKRVSTGLETGDESVELARAEHELARALVMADNNDRVEPLLVSAREKIEKLLGREHPDLGPVLYDLAALYDSSARYEQAEPLYRQALEITERSFGQDSPRLGGTLSKLAGLYEEIEMETKSEPLYIRALEIKQKVLGENHPDVGTILNHLANLLKQQGKYAEAEPMFTRSLAIAEVALGKNHPNLAVVLNNMAELYSEMGNEAQAEHFQERAFSLFGLPGMGDGFVEMDKDDDYEVDNDKDQTVAGN